MLLQLNQDGTAQKYEEPYLTLEFKTKEDWDRFKERYKIEDGDEAGE